MDTKWKNTAADENQKNISFILGWLLIAAGVAAAIYVLYRNRFYISSLDAWKLGIIFNIAIGAGLSLVVPKFLELYYKNWNPENSDFYHSWKKVWNRQQKGAAVVGCILLAVAVLNLNSMMRGGYYYPNFAVGYLMVATVAIQFGVAEFWMIRFMKERLDMLMDCVNELNKARL